MKKLLLLITTFSFLSVVAMDTNHADSPRYIVIAMDPTSLVTDPNALDQHGNTRLHNAVITWQKSTTNTQAIHHKKAIVELIQNGSSIITPNSHNKTVAELCPQLIKEIVYWPLFQAVAAGDIPTLEEYLRIGADPDFDLSGMTAFQESVNGNKPEAAKKLLFGGAKLTTQFKCAGRGAINALHLVANRGTYQMVEALLCSPQGSPTLCTNTHRLRKTCKEMFAFLCCMNRKKDTESLEIPGEVLHHISVFLLPEAKELIGEVSLEQLPQYLSLKVHGKTVLNKTALINALTQRHMELIAKALFTKSDVNLGIVIWAEYPHQFPRLAGVNNLDLSKDTEAVQRALDPANFEQHRAAITANYRKLLE